MGVLGNVFGGAVKSVTDNAVYSNLFGSSLWTGILISAILAIIALFLFKDSVVDKKEVCMTSLKVFLIGSLVSIAFVYLNNGRVVASTEKNLENTNTHNVYKEVSANGEIIGGLEDAFIPLSGAGAKLGVGGIVTDDK
jgi:uncharacterized membrane protein